MKRKIYIVIYILIFIITSCKTNEIFSSFIPFHDYEILPNINKLGPWIMQEDSNLIAYCQDDTFQIHFDINNDNALIFSVDKIDTVGFIKIKKKEVYYYPKDIKETYKLFDFNAKVNDSYKIANCGPLDNKILTIKNVEKINDEIIQTISVESSTMEDPNIPLPPPCPYPLTELKSFKVSSLYGIIEIDIFVGWSEDEIKIKTPHNNL